MCRPSCLKRNSSGTSPGRRSAARDEEVYIIYIYGQPRAPQKFVTLRDSTRYGAHAHARLRFEDVFSSLVIIPQLWFELQGSWASWKQAPESILPRSILYWDEVWALSPFGFGERCGPVRRLCLARSHSGPWSAPLPRDQGLLHRSQITLGIRRNTSLPSGRGSLTRDTRDTRPIRVVTSSVREYLGAS